MDVMPMTWKSACASDSEKIAASFALPYGRARNRTRRIRSATLWINRDKAVSSYTFNTDSKLHLAAVGRIICGKNAGVKGAGPSTLYLQGYGERSVMRADEKRTGFWNFRAERACS